MSDLRDWRFPSALRPPFPGCAACQPIGLAAAYRAFFRGSANPDSRLWQHLSAGLLLCCPIASPSLVGQDAAITRALFRAAASPTMAALAVSDPRALPKGHSCSGTAPIRANCLDNFHAFGETSKVADFG
jgi:hypothetical protein